MEYFCYLIIFQCCYMSKYRYNNYINIYKLYYYISTSSPIAENKNFKKITSSLNFINDKNENLIRSSHAMDTILYREK